MWRVLIRQVDCAEFAAPGGGWTRNPAAALVFHDVESARKHCQEQKLANVCLMLVTRTVGEDVDYDGWMILPVPSSRQPPNPARDETGASTSGPPSA